MSSIGTLQVRRPSQQAADAVVAHLALTGGGTAALKPVPWRRPPGAAADVIHGIWFYDEAEREKYGRILPLYVQSPRGSGARARQLPPLTRP